MGNVCPPHFILLSGRTAPQSVLGHPTCGHLVWIRLYTCLRLGQPHPPSWEFGVGLRTASRLANLCRRGDVNVVIIADHLPPSPAAHQEEENRLQSARQEAETKLERGPAWVPVSHPSSDLMTHGFIYTLACTLQPTQVDDLQPKGLN